MWTSKYDLKELCVDATFFYYEEKRILFTKYEDAIQSFKVLKKAQRTVEKLFH